MHALQLLYVSFWNGWHTIGEKHYFLLHCSIKLRISVKNILKKNYRFYKDFDKNFEKDLEIDFGKDFDRGFDKDFNKDFDKDFD